MFNDVDLVIKNGLVYSEGTFLNGGIVIKDEKIIAITTNENLPKGKETIDAKGNYILPGSIDTHVHFRDPGRSDRETFSHGTRAAAAGGVTTVLEHPISSPPQYSPEILHNRIEVAKPQAYVDYAFYGAAGAEFPEEISRISKEGIVAYKTFLHLPPEGRDKEFIGLTMANDGEILDGFKEVAKTGLICAVHAENNDIIARNINKLRAEGRTDYLAHAESRPPISEIETVSKILNFAKLTGARVEFAHISTPEAMELVKKAKYNGQDVYLETCPHYLFLNEEDLKKHGPFAKCNPPLRPKETSDKLWKYVNDGSVDFIGSDHGPFLLSEKELGLNDIFKSPAGFPGIDLRVPLMLDAVNNNKITLEKTIELLCTNPSKIFGIYPKKGVIRVGSDADIIIVNMNEKQKINKEKMYSKSKEIAKIYEGRELKCRIDYTIVRGNIIMKDGIVSKKNEGYGQLITVQR